MTIDESIKHLERIFVNEKENQFYVFSTTSISVALDAMRKYQEIEQIYQQLNEVNDFSYNQAMQKIGEVIEDGSGKRL